MQRRSFIFACAATLTAPPLAALSASATPRIYRRARLTDMNGKPLKARQIAPNRNFVFHYPFAGTPCFLLNLGRPTKTEAELKTADARNYRWPGGVGTDRSIVAYSAICAHKLTYPTREISFISYRDEKTPGNRFDHVIHCCSEHSQYDPADGAKVLAGPAPQPLAAILLDHDARTDELHAVGTLGGELFDDFFAKYAFRLTTEHNGRARAAVEGDCKVTELTQYCRQQVRC